MDSLSSAVACGTRGVVQPWFYAMQQQGNDTLISDLHMGEAQNYTFTFNLGSSTSPERALEREASVRSSLAQAWYKLRERL